ncbi:ABC transporter permease [Chloroflexi bacterium TSY]|nr:ABC transporter permease [Chloroflexi bacterium TSY]
MTWLLILLNEIYKDLLLKWNYKLGQIGVLFFYAFLYVAHSFLVGDGRFAAGATAGSFIGYTVWYYFRQINVSMTATLRNEAQTGTLEQRYMSPAPSGLVQLGRTMSTLVLITIFALIITFPLLFLLRIDIPFRLGALPVFGLTLVGLYGFGFLMGGATLLFKRIGNLLFLFQIMILYANGTFVPLDQLPRWLATLSWSLPTTQGIALLRNVLVEDHSIGSTFVDGSLFWLTLNSLVYFVIGWFLFAWCEKSAKRRGTLGHY